MVRAPGNMFAWAVEKRMKTSLWFGRKTVNKQFLIQHNICDTVFSGILKHHCYIDPCPCPCLRWGAGDTFAREPGRGSGGGDEWRKLHLSPRFRWRIPQPHCDPGPTRPRQQDCHTGRKIPWKGWDKTDGESEEGREQRRHTLREKTNRER